MEPFQPRSQTFNIPIGVSSPSSGTPVMSNREPLILAIREIAKLYGELSDKHRQNAFDMTASILSYLPDPIPTGPALRKISGIGKSSAEIIEEWFRTGKIQRLEELRKRVANLGENTILVIQSPEEMEKEKSIKLFQEIHGVGPKIAEKWYLLGWRTLDDIEIDQLTHAQRIGLHNFTDLKEKIPRAEIEVFRKYLQIMLPKVTFQICGSFRRGATESGDIDVLLMETEGYTLAYIVKEMMVRNLITDQLALGPTKFMGIIRLSPEHKIRRLDLRWVPKNVWSFATLYFTGCGELNIKMRQKAITMGLTLNEYCLTSSTGEVIACPTEEAIFAALNMGYLSPTKRSAAGN